MDFLFNILKGMLIGIANVIPGVSGGTMAVSLGIYDRLIGCISSLFRSFKKSVSFLLPILIGCVLGIVCFTYIIEYLLSRHTFVTCMAFIGLILGGVPILLSALKKSMRTRHRRKIGVCGILAFLAAFAVCAGLPLLNAEKEGLTFISVNAGNMVILFFLGIIASATMVVPGVSGSMMLMIFGYYYGIINTIKGFLDALRAMEPAGMIDGFLLLAPFGVGILLGIFLIAGLITFLFERFGTETYCAILGLVLASPVAIFINTGLFSLLPTLDLWAVVFGVVLLAAGAMLTNLIGEK